MAPAAGSRASRAFESCPRRRPPYSVASATQLPGRPIPGKLTKPQQKSHRSARLLHMGRLVIQRRLQFAGQTPILPHSTTAPWDDDPAGRHGREEGRTRHWGRARWASACLASPSRPAIARDGRRTPMPASATPRISQEAPNVARPARPAVSWLVQPGIGSRRSKARSTPP